jgi:hypothetical protein
VKIPKQVTAGNIGHNMFYRSKRQVYVGGVVHGKENTSNNLKCKKKTREGSEASVVVQTFRGRIVKKVVRYCEG